MTVADGIAAFACEDTLLGMLLTIESCPCDEMIDRMLET